MNNYEYCVNWGMQQSLDKTFSILDYGCGSGTIVKSLRANKLNSFGCDVFYEGGDYSNQVDEEIFKSGIIRRMLDGKIPFDSECFDVVINNQVFEHVENLDDVLTECHRVLKPGGIILSLFPSKDVWREGHCGIPFLHWFPKKSSLRIYYALLFRIIGFGYHHENKPPIQWSSDFCDWLDKWTYYRSKKYIHQTYTNHFIEVNYIEDDWLQKRLGSEHYAIKCMPKSIQKIIVRKLAGLVITAKKTY